MGEGYWSVELVRSLCPLATLSILTVWMTDCDPLS